ncbi:chorismate synthase [Babesia caballi]|uniref:Chorismate synthase n=1 Tax=Babesia caballi TaxID=5871 RepID=A0AAV4M1U7_BABCB|nr:chorismate synthase [Babesia caballi]
MLLRKLKKRRSRWRDDLEERRPGISSSNASRREPPRALGERFFPDLLDRVPMADLEPRGAALSSQLSSLSTRERPLRPSLMDRMRQLVGDRRSAPQSSSRWLRRPRASAATPPPDPGRTQLPSWSTESSALTGVGERDADEVERWIMNSWSLSVSCLTPWEKLVSLLPSLPEGARSGSLSAIAWFPLRRHRFRIFLTGVEAPTSGDAGVDLVTDLEGVSSSLSWLRMKNALTVRKMDRGGAASD